MLKKGVAQIRSFANLKCDRIIISYDADGPHNKAEIRRQEVITKLIKPAGVSSRCCALIPTQEIEAWILAHLPAVTVVFTAWRPKESYPNPELVPSPKEVLIKLSRDPETRKARYVPHVHNEIIAEHLDTKELERKCPSFKELVTFVKNSTGKKNKNRKR